MKCSACNTELPQQMNFCHHCGAAARARPEEAAGTGQNAAPGRQFLVGYILLGGAFVLIVGEAIYVARHAVHPERQATQASMILQPANLAPEIAWTPPPVVLQQGCPVCPAAVNGPAKAPPNRPRIPVERLQDKEINLPPRDLPPTPPPSPAPPPNLPPTQQSPEPAPQRGRPAYQGPSAGTLIWSGQIRENTLVRIEGDQVAPGRLTGELPGVPVTIETPSEFVVAEAPSPANNWKRLYLRSVKRINRAVVIKWSLQPSP